MTTTNENNNSRSNDDEDDEYGESLDSMKDARGISCESP